MSEELEQCLSGTEDTADSVDGVLLAEAISKFLRSLREQHRNIFLRRYWYFDSIAEIGRRFEMSENNVKSVLFRTRNALKEYLITEGYTF